MAELKRVLTEPWDVNRRLAQLGLTSEVLTKAVESAQAAWSACTENDPPNFPGIASWAAAVRSLRGRFGLAAMDARERHRPAAHRQRR